MSSKIDLRVFPKSPLHRSCASNEPDLQCAYCTSAVRSTSSRKYRLRSCAVRRSTRRLANRQAPPRVGPCKSRPVPSLVHNSTSRSMSLAGFTASVSIDPNNDSRRIWCCMQKRANTSGSIGSCFVMVSLPKSVHSELNGTYYPVLARQAADFRTALHHYHGLLLQSLF